MDRRRLRGTELDVSVLCYGPMRLARAPGHPGLKQHRAAMAAALDHGVNFMHSSYEYGVRWLMHEVLKSHAKRHDLLHVIKVPVPDWSDQRFDPVRFEAHLDAALRDLCTERIALVQWMWRCRPHEEPARLALLSEIRGAVNETAERMRDKGKMAHLACFPYLPQSAAVAMQDPSMRALIAYYNAFETEMAPVIDTLERDGRSFLAIRPLFEGVLTDRFAGHGNVPPDHRLSDAKYRAAFRLRERLVQELPEGGLGMTRFALRFPLMSPHCASVIVGMNTPAQVAELCRMAEGVRPDPNTVAQVRALARPT